MCSRLTDVSTCTFDGITFVASKRPPRPASITATSTPRRAELVVRRRGQGLELGHVVVRSAVRFTICAASAARVTAAAKSASDTGSSPTSIRSRNERRCGDV